MTKSGAATVRKALHDMGLIDNSGQNKVPPALSQIRKAAAQKAVEARRLKKLALDGCNQGQIEQKTEDTTKIEQISPASGLVKALPVAASDQNDQTVQTVQQSNIAKARQIINDASVKAAQYLSDLVGGVIDAPERIKLEAAKVILQSQGVTGEQSAQQREKDISAMSKADLLAFIKAGSIELQRLKAARDAEIIDVSPNPLDTESNANQLE